MVRDKSKKNFSPRPRAVVLGASNVVRSFATLLASCRAARGGPLELIAAMGHGRSYGLRTLVVARQLPGIVHCGIWEHLASLPPADTTVLLTDVGNDLLYGMPVEQIAEWVETCLVRLAPTARRSVLTGLPLDNLPQLSEARFRLFRTAFFPFCRLSLSQLVDRARALDDRLAELASRHNVRRVVPRAEWYGIDPIHLRIAAKSVAWSKLLAPWNDDEAPAPVSGSWSHWWGAPWIVPHQRWLFGMEQRRAQPAWHLPDGTSVAVF